MTARALHGQASDVALCVEDNPAKALSSLECQREFNQGVLAKLTRRRLAHLLEATKVAGRVCPCLGDAADDILVAAKVAVKLPARLFQPTFDEVAEKCTRAVRSIGRDSGHGRFASSC
ncbi:MAG TPA: hypothetical protein VEH05_17200 [Streptosporangiaceae bacterium]|nr:hypothetical protein [Streptosporangiaceae bacterium]